MNDSLEVCALVEYDLFPHYLVVKGYFQDDGSIKCPGLGIYKESSILKILPASLYSRENNRVKEIKDKYEEYDRNIKKELLKLTIMKDKYQ